MVSEGPTDNGKREKSTLKACPNSAMGDPFRVDVPSHVLSAGRTDLRLLRGDAFSVFQSQHEFFYLFSEAQLTYFNDTAKLEQQYDTFAAFSTAQHIKSKATAFTGNRFNLQ